MFVLREQRGGCFVSFEFDVFDFKVIQMYLIGKWFCVFVDIVFFIKVICGLGWFCNSKVVFSEFDVFKI